MKKTLFAITASILAFYLTGCGKKKEEPKPPSVTTPTQTQQAPANIDVKSKIAEYAIIPMTKAQYPRTYSEWGASGLKHINALLPKVAEQVARNPSCDRVEMVELSATRSIPKKEAVFFVDCNNRQRFYVSENEINSSASTPSVGAQASATSDKEYLKTCMDQVQNRVTHPSTFDPSILSSNVHRAPQTGRVVVTLPFEAKNSFNLKLKHTAICNFDDRGLREVNIKESK